MIIIGERINGMFKDIARLLRNRIPVQSRSGPASRNREAQTTLT